MVLVYISLLINDIKNLCVFTGHLVCPSMKCLLKSLPLFPQGTFNRFLLCLNCCISRGLQGNKISKMYIFLGNWLMQLWKSEIRRAGQQAANTGRISVTILRQNSFFSRKPQVYFQGLHLIG